MTRIRTWAFIAGLVLVGCKKKEDAGDAFSSYSAAYTPTYDKYSSLHIGDLQQAILGAGDAGKPLQADYDALAKRRDELEQLIMDANKQAGEAQSKNDVALMHKATEMLAKADKLADSIKADMAALRAKVPAAAPTP